MYRAVCAREVYLAQDRWDLLYTSKELARGMYNPNKTDVDRLKRRLWSMADD